MADGNLLSVLSANKYKGLQNLVLFGRVRCAIEKPDFLDNLEASNGGFFALLDAYGVKCLGQDYFGNLDSGKVYYIRGSVLIYLNDKNLIGENVKVFGSNKSKGVNIRRQFDASLPTEGVSAFAFKRVNSAFVVSENACEVLVPKDVAVRGTSLEDFITDIVINKYAQIEYPETLNSITEFSGSVSYTELNLDELSDSSSTFEFIDTDERVDVSKPPVDLEYHFAEDIEESYLLNAIWEEVNTKSKKRYHYAMTLIESVKDMIKLEDLEDFDPEEHGYKDYLTVEEIADTIVELFIKNIASRYNEKMPDSKLRYGQYVDIFLDSLYKTKWKDDEKEKLSMKAIQPCIDSVKERVSHSPEILYGDDYDYENGSGGIPLLQNSYKFASLAIGSTLGIPEHDLVVNFNQCHTLYNMSIEVWFGLLIRNPYALALVSRRLGLGDCDRIAFSYSKVLSKGILKDECKETRENLMFVEYMSNLESKDSFLSGRVLAQTLKGNYPWFYRRGILDHGFPCNKDDTICAQNLLGKKLMGTVPKSACYTNPYTKERIDILCNKYGLIQDLDTDKNKYYALASDVEKEYFIYKKLYGKGQSTSGITDELIEETTAEFEEKCGFKLEPLQREAIKLCKYEAGVLSGCAGSGKTTTSDCMTMIFKKAFPKKSIRYSTPTGKACRRLAEVTGGDVKTLHSRFGIGMYSDPYLCSIGEGRTTREECIYIFDEMAMCSMDLLYSTVYNLSPTGDLVYFLGDVKQLPPIGRGNPFKLLMQFLPCVELGVSKRAAEGSLVNYNTSLISNFSDGILHELQYDNTSFIRRECSDVEISNEVNKMFKDFMSGKATGKSFDEDDIQVITGYQKEDCLFSAPVLNKPLHKTLRANDRVLFTYEGKEFCMNERVIHLNRNAYEMPRYRKTGNGIYECIVTFGAVNGETGKITGFVRSDMITTTPFDIKSYLKEIPKDADDEESKEKKKLAELYADKSDIIVDNSIYNDSEIYFVEVTVYDVSLKENVYLLYRAVKRESTLTGVYFDGGDLANLEYAYALTTHKMQGSQSPVVICAFGSTCNPEFINRNMINTMFTRSQGIVGVVGTVMGDSSPINLGRRYASQVYCKDTLSLLTGVEFE